MGKREDRQHHVGVGVMMLLSFVLLSGSTSRIDVVRVCVCVLIRIVKGRWYINHCLLETNV